LSVQYASARLSVGVFVGKPLAKFQHLTGATPGEIRHVALLAITTRGFPSGIAALGWIDEVLDAPESPK